MRVTQSAQSCISKRSLLVTTSLSAPELEKVPKDVASEGKKPWQFVYPLGFLFYDFDMVEVEIEHDSSAHHISARLNTVIKFEVAQYSSKFIKSGSDRSSQISCFLWQKNIFIFGCSLKPILLCIVGLKQDNLVRVSPSILQHDMLQLMAFTKCGCEAGSQTGIAGLPYSNRTPVLNSCSWVPYKMYSVC